MPTYDYVCAACAHRFEAFQEMSAKKHKKCPKCGKSALERQVGAGAGLIFKGSGFYITDYKRSGAAPESGNGGEKKEAASDSKADTKAPSDGEKTSKSGAADAKPPAAPAPPAPPASPSKSGSKRGAKGSG